MNIKVNLQRWNDNFVVRIPYEIVVATKVAVNQEFVISLKNDSIILKPSRKIKARTPKDMFNSVTPKDIGGEVAWGDDVGNEFIDE